jgi:hypothetical protein
MQCVHDLNMTELQALNLPCTCIIARYESHDRGSAAAKAAPDEAGGLNTHVYLAIGAKVMIMQNIWQTQGVPLHFFHLFPCDIYLSF